MKYWAYMNNEILGPFEKEKLLELAQFSNSTLICPQAPVGEKTEDWKEASTFPEIAALISSGTGSGAPRTAAPGEFKPSSGLTLTDNSGLALNIPELKQSSLPSSAPKPEASAPEASFSSSNFDPISISKIGMMSPGIGGLSAHTASNIDPVSLSSISKKQEGMVPSGESASHTREISLDAPAETPGLNKIPEQTPSEVPQVQASAIDNITPVTENNAGNPVLNPEPAVELSKGNPDLTPKPVQEAAPSINIEIQTEPAPKKEPVSSPAPLPAPDNSEMIKLIEKFASNSASKEDIEALKNGLSVKMDEMDRKLSAMDFSSIESSVKSLEIKISQIEGKITSLKAEQTPKPAPGFQEISLESRQSKSPADLGTTRMASEPQKGKPAEEKKDETPKNSEPKKKFSLNLGKIFKPLFKLIGGLIVLILIAGVAVFALKQAGIINLTPYITRYVNIPFLASPKPPEEPVSAFPASSSSSGAQNPIDVSTDSAQPVSAVPIQEKKEEVKDHSDEAVYMARTYSVSAGRKTLENAVIEHARKLRGKVNAITWKAAPSVDGDYQVVCLVPLRKGNAEYDFSVNYETKEVKPSGDNAEAVFKSLTAPEKKPAPKKVKRNSKKRASEKKSAAVEKKDGTPASVKPGDKSAGDDEYVYEYVDEDEAASKGEQEYELPGVPKKK